MGLSRVRTVPLRNHLAGIYLTLSLALLGSNYRWRVSHQLFHCPHQVTHGMYNIPQTGSVTVFTTECGTHSARGGGNVVW